MTKSGIDGLRIVFGLELSFIDANEFLSLPRFFAEAVVGDSIEPGGETRFTPKTAKVLVSPQKGLLGEVVSQRNVRTNELTEQTSHTRLVIPDQLRKGVVVVVNKNACNEVCIG